MPKGKLLDESNTNKNPPTYLKDTLLTISKIADVLYDIRKENLVQSPDIETDRDNYFEYFTCKKPPYISIIDYLSRIVKYSRPESGTMTISLILIDKFTDSQNILLTKLNIHRIILTSYAKMGGITLKEFNLLKYVRIILLLAMFLYIENN